MYVNFGGVKAIFLLHQANIAGVQEKKMQGAIDQGVCYEGDYSMTT